MKANVGTKSPEKLPSVDRGETDLKTTTSKSSREDKEQTGDAKNKDSHGSGDVHPKHKLSNYSSKLERDFVKELRMSPDAARVQVSDWLDKTRDCITILQTWAEAEGKYGSSLDKIIVSANVLNEVHAGSETGMVAAVAAIVGGFQSLGKHHLGMQQCVLTQADVVLAPLIKDHRKQLQEWSNGQTSIQRETKTLLASVERARETGSALAVQQAAVKYEKQARAQRSSLREFLSHMYTLWLHRAETMLICVDAMAEADQQVLSFSEEVVSALENIVSNLDPLGEVQADVNSIVDLSSQKSPSDPSSDLPTTVYEVLGGVEPDVASASVEAASSTCKNWAMTARVAESVSRELAAAMDQRAKDIDALASTKNLEHLRVSCEYGDVFSEEETKETERQAWRMFMVIMKQSSMVVADFAAKLNAVADTFGAVGHAYESSRKQVLAARSAAHKELQLVAHSLKEARARVDHCDENIGRIGGSRERALSEVSDLRAKIRNTLNDNDERAGAATPDQQLASNGETPISAEGGAATSDVEGATDTSGIHTGADNNEANAQVPVIDDDTSSVASGGTAGSSAAGGSKSVVKRLFRLSGPTQSEALAEAEDKYDKMSHRLSILQEQRATLQDEVEECSDRLEAQIKAFAVQIAGTVSGFVSIHQTKTKDMKHGLEKLVLDAGNYTATIQQLDRKMMQELKKMDPVKDIDRFTTQAPPQPSEALIQGPFESVTKNADGEDDNEDEDASTDEDEEGEKLGAPNPRAAFQKKKLKLTESEMLTEEYGLPPNETIVASYSCAYLPGKVPQQGRLILTKQFLCFSTLAIYEPVFGSCKLVVHLANVTKVIKAATAWGLVANTLVVRLQPRSAGQSPPELTFTSLFHRDKCHDRLVQLAGVNRDLVEKGTNKKFEDGAPWHELDPRLGEGYKGNKLVIGTGVGAEQEGTVGAADGSSGTSSAGTSSPDTRKTRNSGFLRLGLSTQEVQEMVEAKERSGGDVSSSDGSSKESGGSGAFSQPCVQCLRPPSSEPCPCWKVDVPKSLTDHKELSTSFWRGSIETVAAVLFLGRQKLDLTLPVDCDIGREFGETSGDYEQDFESFRFTANADTDVQAYHRDEYPDASYLNEDDETPTKPSIIRVSSFAHPVGSSPWGKQVARSTQVQRVVGVIPKDDTDEVFIVPETAMPRQVVLNCDTSLAGFPFSDSFMVRTRYVLTEMTNTRKTHPDESWCRLDVTCRVKWLKAVSVPFLKGKIEKENIATGKRNMVAWIELAKTKMPTEPASLGAAARGATSVVSPSKGAETSESASSGAVSSESAESLKTSLQEFLGELLEPAFYSKAWQEANPPQRLQLLLLLTIVFLQLFIVFQIYLYR